MSLRVLKFQVPVPQVKDGTTYVRMPSNARLLSVGFQETAMVVWVLVSSKVSGGEIARKLTVVNTGQDFDMTQGVASMFAVAMGDPPPDTFVGTVTSPGGTVWHVWDGGEVG